jgi:hypothetical protein
VAYSYLFKNLEFEKPFERISRALPFGDERVSAFGMDESTIGHEEMLPQVTILDYQSRDDFVIELKTKSPSDRLILAKINPCQTLEETIRQVGERARFKGCPAQHGDVLAVPKLNFDLTRSHRELQGRLKLKNPRLPKDLSIVKAMQNICFQMDEKGVRLRSEASISIGCGSPGHPPPQHTMIFDKPFLIVMRRQDAAGPYFALWVGNAELLIKS